MEKCNQNNNDIIDLPADNSSELDHFNLFCTAIDRKYYKHKLPKLDDMQNLSQSNNWIINFIYPLPSLITPSNYDKFLPQETIAYNVKEEMQFNPFS